MSTMNRGRLIPQTLLDELRRFETRGGAMNVAVDERTKPDPQAEVRAYCAKRFAEEMVTRRRYGCRCDHPASAEYTAGLERYIRVEAKCRADEAR